MANGAMVSLSLDLNYNRTDAVDSSIVFQMWRISSVVFSLFLPVSRRLLTRAWVGVDVDVGVDTMRAARYSYSPRYTRSAFILK